MQLYALNVNLLIKTKLEIIMDNFIKVIDENIIAKTIAISFGTMLGAFLVLLYSAHLMGY